MVSFPQRIAISKGMLCTQSACVVRADFQTTTTSFDFNTGEEEERKYFPERYKYHPFGDPFREKRRRAAQAKERERRRKERERRRKEQQQQRYGGGTSSWW